MSFGSDISGVTVRQVRFVPCVGPGATSFVSMRAPTRPGRHLPHRVGPYPVQRAEQELGLKTLGPPWPPPDLTPGQRVAALASLPLLDQPGSRWRYNTGATVAGVLIERGACAPLAEVLRERVFEPLGMADTGFWVPPAKRDRLAGAHRARAGLLAGAYAAIDA